MELDKKNEIFDVGRATIWNAVHKIGLSTHLGRQEMRIRVPEHKIATYLGDVIGYTLA